MKNVKLSFIGMMLIFASAILYSCAPSKEEVVKQSIENLFYDIAHQKIDHFHIITKAKVESWGLKESDLGGEGSFLYMAFKEEKVWLESWTNEVLVALHEAGADKGLNWNSYKVTAVESTIEDYDEDAKKMMIGKTGYIAQGTATIESNGKQYKFEFKDLAITDGEAFLVRPQSFE